MTADGISFGLVGAGTPKACPEPGRPVVGRGAPPPSPLIETGADANAAYRGRLGSRPFNVPAISAIFSLPGAHWRTDWRTNCKNRE